MAILAYLKPFGKLFESQPSKLFKTSLTSRCFWCFISFTNRAQWVIQEVFLGGDSTNRWSSTHKKQLGICIEYKYISEFMLWLPQGKFVKKKKKKIPSLAALQVAKYMITVK